MAYDEHLAERIVRLLEGDPAWSTRKMFGGLCLLHHGNMAAGILGEDLMVRVGPLGYDQALQHPHVREMDFTGRPLRGMVMVDGSAVGEDEELTTWLGRGLAYVADLPPK